ncbi:hypothetical protein [Mucilaginibacter celer]|uniref:Uncharacterized protein n=1 Tax=Mucilaginibacter celer TaxID=2305508 RepID=A0A494VMA3_9SPHI|nr:hypothetical protein [Mucilaginibacter celer]AYL96436.1 hypothetical protein HYN43_014525 [Mucilaginibacter celer]
MKQSATFHRPFLRTKGFSTFHIHIFELILLGKANREINRLMGYTPKSHMVVDHSRQVMNKLLCYEGLCKKDYKDRVVYPRKYQFWWKKLLEKHKNMLIQKAIIPEYYDETIIPGL